MQVHIIKARISHITKYSSILPCNLSIFTKLSKQDYHTYKPHGLTPKFLSPNVVDTKRHLMQFNKCIIYRHVARLSTVEKETEVKEDENSNYRGKTWKDNSPMILLIDDKGKVSSISLFKAQRMVKRKDMKMVKVEDSSVSAEDKQVYKLLTGRQYYEEEVKSRKRSKPSGSKFQPEKTLTLSGKIATHDLNLKLKNVQKWLSKGHQVRVTIMSAGATKGDMDNVYKVTEREMQNIKGCILQRQETSGRLKFLINPPKETIVNKEETINQDDQNH